MSRRGVRGDAVECTVAGVLDSHCARPAPGRARWRRASVRRRLADRPAPLPDRRQQPAEQPTDCAPAADRAREQVPEVVSPRPRRSSARRAPRSGASPAAGRGDRAVSGASVGARGSAGDGSCRTTGGASAIGWSLRATEGFLGRRSTRARDRCIARAVARRRGQDLLVGGERSMAFHREVAPRERRAPRASCARRSRARGCRRRATTPARRASAICSAPRSASPSSEDRRSVGPRPARRARPPRAPSTAHRRADRGARAVPQPDLTVVQPSGSTRRSAQTAAAEHHRERVERADPGRVVELDPGLDAVLGDASVPLAQRDAQLEAGEVRAEAAVDAAAEREVPVRPRGPSATSLGVGELGLVDVGRAEQRPSPVRPSLIGAAADLGVAAVATRATAHHRRLPAQQLLDHRRDRRRVARRSGGALGVLARGSRRSSRATR